MIFSQQSIMAKKAARRCCWPPTTLTLLLSQLFDDLHFYSLNLLAPIFLAAFPCKFTLFLFSPNQFIFIIANFSSIYLFPSILLFSSLFSFFCFFFLMTFLPIISFIQSSLEFLFIVYFSFFFPHFLDKCREIAEEKFVVAGSEC